MATTFRRFMHRLQRHLWTALDNYSIRFSIGLVASLLVVIGLTRLPLHAPTPRVGWDVVDADEGIQISDFRLETDDASPTEPETPASEAPITVQGERSNPPPDEAPPPLRTKSLRLRRRHRTSRMKRLPYSGTPYNSPPSAPSAGNRGW